MSTDMPTGKMRGVALKSKALPSQILAKAVTEPRSIFILFSLLSFRQISHSASALRWKHVLHCPT